MVCAATCVVYNKKNTVSNKKCVINKGDTNAAHPEAWSWTLQNLDDRNETSNTKLGYKKKFHFKPISYIGYWIDMPKMNESMTVSMSTTISLMTLYHLEYYCTAFKNLCCTCHLHSDSICGFFYNNCICSCNFLLLQVWTFQMVHIIRMQVQ